MKTVFIIADLLLVVFAFSVGAYSFISNPKSKVIRLWVLLSAAITLWSFGYFIALTASGITQAETGIYLLYLGTTFIPILTFHFISNFLLIPSLKLLRILYLVGYVLALLFIYLIYRTNLVIDGVRFTSPFGYYEQISQLFPLFLIYFGFFVILSIILLIKKLLHSDGYRKKQITYVLIAMLIGFIGGGSNFVYDINQSIVYP